MTIGEVSRRSGVGVETIRYYERTGFVPAPARSAGGYRRYTAQDLERLRVIRLARGVGFDADEVAGLVALCVDPAPRCPGQCEALARQFAVLCRKRRHLETLQRLLERRTRQNDAVDGMPPSPIESSRVD